MSNFFKLIFSSLYYYFKYLKLIIGKKVSQDDKQRCQGKVIYQFLNTMGPLYIKLGQILSTRSDLIPNAWVVELSKLQDDTIPMKEKILKKWLRQSLSQSFEQTFKNFNFTPLASASIAQVHEATLVSGEVVAVKLIKRNVRSEMRNNLNLIRYFISVACLFSLRLKQLELKERFKELSILLQEQTNFVKEQQNQKQVYENYVSHRYVIVPKVYSEHSNENIIVMEMMLGIPGKQVEKVKLDRKILARRLQDTIYTMLYMHGFCHGDPHPGNIMFTEEGKLILLDFGITVSLTENEKWGLSSFYYACTRKEWDVAVLRFTNHFVTRKEKVLTNWDEYQAEIKDVLKLHFDTLDNRWSTIGYFNDINKVLQKYQARYTANFTKVELVFLGCEGFATEIDPNINIWGNARIFTDRFSPYMSKEVKARFDAYFEEKMPTSMELKRAADESLVAPTHIHRYFFPSSYPVFIDKAENGYFIDKDGNKFIDLSGGYGPHILGYKHPVIQKALFEGIENGLVNAIGHEPEVELAKRLVSAFPGAARAVLCNSGTEANLMAIRLARAYTKKNRVAKFEGHYHGWSDQGMVSSWFRFNGSLSHPQPISGSQGTDKYTIQHTSIFQYGDQDALQRLVDEADETACVICEPMPSSIAQCDVGFLKKLREICNKHNVVLIFDEVVTGFRVDYGGAQTLAKVIPDLTALGKIIGGGLPCGAVVGKKEIVEIAKSSQDPFFDYDNKAFVGGTMSGNSLTCQAGISVLDYLYKNQHIYQELQEKSTNLAETFRCVAKELNVDLQLEARHSIFSMTFGHKSSKFYRKKQAGSNFKANIALAYYMRKHDVYLPELHSFMLSAAHTLDDLNIISNAFKLSLTEMVNDGFFVD
ncbi:aminotransferase class III-fold pyridoxal phosphate-dependent enzyme [Xenorhabdus taiwanensis]|uniref:Protein kinase domain-containing protein n=1 Tax=Xenorhabdus taiwanensis TaxID=3085177 RepID=A0ABM8JTD5_9GAMM|nr:hypothetical protein TCT1_08680 [Xenorhabdus sp. TCT-1]